MFRQDIGQQEHRSIECISPGDDKSKQCELLQDKDVHQDAVHRDKNEDVHLPKSKSRESESEKKGRETEKKNFVHRERVYRIITSLSNSFVSMSVKFSSDTSSVNVLFPVPAMRGAVKRMISFTSPS